MISRLPNTIDERNSTRYVKETDLFPPSPSILPINNDENELDLTTFVPPPVIRKPPSSKSGSDFSKKGSL